MAKLTKAEKDQYLKDALEIEQIFIKSDSVHGADPDVCQTYYDGCNCAGPDGVRALFQQRNYMQTVENKAREYLKSVCNIAPFPLRATEAFLPSALDLLIESHKRQVKAISLGIDKDISRGIMICRQNQRLKWLPASWRRWLRGEE